MSAVLKQRSLDRYVGGCWAVGFFSLFFGVEQSTILALQLLACNLRIELLACNRRRERLPLRDMLLLERSLAVEAAVVGASDVVGALPGWLLVM